MTETTTESPWIDPEVEMPKANEVVLTRWMQRNGVWAHRFAMFYPRLNEWFVSNVEHFDGSVPNHWMRIPE